MKMFAIMFVLAAVLCLAGGGPQPVSVSSLRSDNQCARTLCSAMVNPSCSGQVVRVAQKVHDTKTKTSDAAQVVDPNPPNCREVATDEFLSCLGVLPPSIVSRNSKQQPTTKATTTNNMNK
jgi:hypothetical protein